MKNKKWYLWNVILTGKTDKEVYEEINIMIVDNSKTTISNMNKGENQEIIRKIKNVEGISQRQIARVLGVPQHLVFTS